jgi:hypothetical protein
MHLQAPTTATRPTIVETWLYARYAIDAVDAGPVVQKHVVIAICTERR